VLGKGGDAELCFLALLYHKKSAYQTFLHRHRICQSRSTAQKYIQNLSNLLICDAKIQK